MDDEDIWHGETELGHNSFATPASPDTYSANGDGDDMDDDDDNLYAHLHRRRRWSPPQPRNSWFLGDPGAGPDIGASLMAELQQTGDWGRTDQKEAWPKNIKPTDRAELKRKGSWLDEDRGEALGGVASASAELKRSKEAWFSDDSLEKDIDDIKDDLDPDPTTKQFHKKTWLGGHERAELNHERVELTVDGMALNTEDDVYQQLAQKEQDLVLAAELGKALLEKNQELEQQLASLSEEFTRKVEVLEQERHTLQSQLTNRQAEHDNTVRDLQEDIGQLTEQLRHHDDETSAGQRRHVLDLRQLQQQNEQLSEQLRQSAAQQQALSAEAGQLREQLTSRRSNFHRKFDQVDELEDEVEYLRQRHQELEIQIKRVKEERDALTSELENLHERLLLLEKQRLQKDEQIQHQHTEILELRDTNSALQSQLEDVTSRHRTSGDSPTLFAELSHLNNNSRNNNGSSGNSSDVIQFHDGEKVGCLPTDMIEDDDFEYDEDIFGDVITHSSPVPRDPANTSGNSLQEELLGQWSQQSIIEAEKGGVGEREAMEGAVGGREIASPSRRHLTLTDELQEILKDMYSDADSSDDETHTQHEEMLDVDVVSDIDEESDAHLNKLTQKCIDDMMQAQQSRIDRLEKRVQELETRVQELQEERDRLQDAQIGDVSLSHVLQETRSERDKALQKVSDVEKELSRLTDDVVTLNSQLMATIQKKVMISQELDQWQVDLSEALAIQVEKRMREYHNAEKSFTVFKRQNLTR